MNERLKNRKMLADFAKYASLEGQHALKMQACLEMVLAFHDSRPWSTERYNEWLELQKRAGVEQPKAECTTRTLCRTIRLVLGIEDEEE